MDFPIKEICYMKNAIRVVFIVFIILFENVSMAEEQVLIKLGEARIEKSKIAIPELQFLGNKSKNKNYGSLEAQIRSVIKNDLNVIGYFKTQSEESFLEIQSDLGLKPFPGDPKGFKWENWKQIGADFLIRVGFNIIGDQLILEAYGYQVTKSQVVISKRYQGGFKDLRKIAHTFCDDFVRAVTGKDTFFLSQIVVTSGASKNSEREVYIMDWDGENKQRITHHRTLTLSPAWSFDGKKLAYTAFMQRKTTKSRNADLFLYDFETNKSKIISYRKGINSGASFDPSGNSLVLTLSGDGNPDIYRTSLSGEIMARLTKGPLGAMNVEPSVSPDGSKIAYSSDRAGRPMVFIMNADGDSSSVPKRITFAGSFNAAPSWSPDGKLLAFSGWASKNFDIFTVTPEGGELKRITKAFRSNGKPANHENPSVSPDGHMIVYTSNRTGNQQLYISTLDGQSEWRITQDNLYYFQPKWSPLIK